MLTQQELYTLRAHPEGSSAMINLHLDALLDHVLSAVQPQGPRARLESKATYGIAPVTYKGDTYRLCGSADYIVRFDDQDRAAVKLVVVTARKLGFKCCSGKSRYSCCGAEQLVALMGGFRPRRLVFVLIL